MPRRASIHNKRDYNERELLGMAASLYVEWIEGGPLDGWIFIREFIPVEIKQHKGAQYQQSQKEFIRACEAYGRPYLIWRTVDQVQRSITLLRAGERKAALACCSRPLTWDTVAAHGKRARP